VEEPVSGIRVSSSKIGVTCSAVGFSFRICDPRFHQAVNRAGRLRSGQYGTLGEPEQIPQ
jgi:hypothetical protein